METVKMIITIVGFLLTFATTAGAFGLKLANANRARKAAAEEMAKAKTEAEYAAAAAAKEKATNDMIATAQELVKSAEKAYAGFDAVMKQQNSSAGAMKKEHVTAKLQTYALSHGYEYDEAFWSDKIDEIVAFTREVNAKKKTPNT